MTQDQFIVIARNERNNLGEAIIGPFESYEAAFQWVNGRWEDHIKWRVSALSKPSAFP